MESELDAIVVIVCLIFFHAKFGDGDAKLTISFWQRLAADTIHGMFSTLASSLNQMTTEIEQSDNISKYVSDADMQSNLLQEHVPDSLNIWCAQHKSNKPNKMEKKQNEIKSTPGLIRYSILYEHHEIPMNF